MLASLAACQFDEQKALSLPDASGRDIPFVHATTETTPVKSPEDAADDSVILVADGDAWIAGTDKQFGLRVYELGGREIISLGVGRLNNIDAIRYEPGAYLLAASNRTEKSIDLFRAVAEDGIEVTPVGRIPLEFEDPYGICMAPIDDADGHSVFVGDKTGRVQWWQVSGEAEGTLREEFRFDSQTEGCVVDRATSTLFVGEEERGIWSVDLSSGDRRLLDAVGAGRLTADVEGLDIYDGSYLVASSQGDHSFVVYALPGGEPLVRFRIRANAEKGIDGASETDGVSVSTAELPGYPEGILVVQDGYNVDPDENQNFKIVDWREVARLIEHGAETGSGGQ